MNVAMRWCVAGSLMALLSGCSGNTELSGTSGEVGEAANASEPAKAVSETQEDARQVLAVALSAAKEDNRRVFVHVGAPW